jgi:hypothetical protein
MGINRNLAYDPNGTTYGFSTAVTLAALATDFCVLIGSPTKTVFLTSIILTGLQTTTGEVNLQLLKRSADNTGGTFTNPTIIPYDSASPASGASGRNYSVNPAALGALVGPVMSLSYPFGSTTTQILPARFYDRNPPEECLTLRGVNELLALNLGGVTIAGGIARVSMRWTESD